MLLVGGSFAALIAGLRVLRDAGAASPELLRKLLHIGMGVVSLSLPWLFDTPWPVLFMASLFGLGLLGGRFSPVWRRIADGIVYGVRRNSFGDLCFPVAIAALFLVSARDPVTFYIPILTMTLADAAAALVGTRRGAHRFGRPGREKSVEGSVAFFIVALPCAYLPLRVWTGGRLDRDAPSVPQPGIAGHIGRSPLLERSGQFDGSPGRLPPPANASRMRHRVRDGLPSRHRRSHDRSRLPLRAGHVHLLRSLGGHP